MRTVQFPPARTYLASFVLAFLACLAWLVLLSFDLFGWLGLSWLAQFALGVFVPLSAAMAILYRTVLFREMHWPRRLFNLFGVAFALSVCAGALLFGFTLLLFGVHPA